MNMPHPRLLDPSRQFRGAFGVSTTEPRPSAAIVRRKPESEAAVRRGWTLVEDVDEYARLRAAAPGPRDWAAAQRLTQLHTQFHAQFHAQPAEPGDAQGRPSRRFRCDLLGWIRRPGQPRRADIVVVRELGADVAVLATDVGLELGEEITLTFRIGKGPDVRRLTFETRVVRRDTNGVELRRQQHADLAMAA